MKEIDENANYEDDEYARNFDKCLREIEKIQKPRRRKWKLYNKAKDFAWNFGFFSFEELENNLKVKETTVNKIIMALINNGIIRKYNNKYLTIYKCDACGKEVERDYISNFNHHFAYGSINDMTLLDVNVCCDCCDIMLEKILPMFKNNPLKDYDAYNHLDKNNHADGILHLELLEEREKDPF